METGKQIKAYLSEIGTSQKFLSYKTGIPMAKLNLALNGKRRLTLDEYALICWALNIPSDKFITPHPPKNKTT